MMFETYADSCFYKDVYGGTIIPTDQLKRALERASRHIDTLTFNRMVATGFAKLTTFQRLIVQKVTCELADFEVENEELINTVLSSYSLNGVSMAFGESWNVSVQNGIAIKRDTFSLLSQTGLCCRSIRGW